MIDNPLSDAGVGRAILATRFYLALQAVKLSFFIGFIPGLLLPLIVWYSTANHETVAIEKMYLWSYVVPNSVQMKWSIKDGSEERTLTIKTIDHQYVQDLYPSQVHEALKIGYPDVVLKFNRALFISVLTSIFGYFFVWFVLNKYGRSRQVHRRIRGANEVVKKTQLVQAVLSVGKSQYSVATVPLPLKSPMTGILIEGAQGTGKSIIIHDLMCQVMRRGRKMIIYDQSGEFFKAYYRPGKDYFFNPALQGSVAWSIFNEITYKYDANTLAYAFLPPKSGTSSGPNAFFEDAARALFAAVLLRLAERGAVNTSDIATAIYSIPDDELDYLIRDTVASSSLGGDSKAQRQGVISSIAIYLDGVAAVKPGEWSVRKFLDEDNDARFFIVNTDDTKAMFAPLFRLLLTVAFDDIAAKGKIVHEDRYWFFLDETHTLGDIRLDEQLAQKRKYGVCIVAGIQSGSQFKTSMGPGRSDTVLNCFNTLVALRCNEPSSQERISKHLGRVEMTTVNQNQALSVTESRDASVLNQNEQDKWVVHPSDIGRLENCVGYIKLAGDYPVAQIDYRDWVPPAGKSLKGYKVSAFQPKQELPLREESFIVSRSANVDPLKSLGAELQNIKNSSDETKDEFAANAHVTDLRDSVGSNSINML